MSVVGHSVARNNSVGSGISVTGDTVVWSKM